MSKLTTLASGQVPPAEAITIVLVEPDDIPASVIIHWPPQPTVSTPRQFAQVAAAAMRVDNIS
jgi:hypothetical protein